MRAISSFVLTMCLAAVCLEAQEVGTATGKGVIERLIPPKSPEAELKSEKVAFSPRYSYAYSEGTGATKSTWLVLTDKEPPLKEWAGSKDRAEARRVWCGKEKASFVALKLDSKSAVDLYFLCPANGSINTEMLSSWNGLESVVVKFDTHDGKRMKGTLRTGQGSCPGADGKDAYCTPTGDFTFDAPMSR